MKDGTAGFATNIHLAARFMNEAFSNFKGWFGFQGLLIFINILLVLFCDPKVLQNEGILSSFNIFTLFLSEAILFAAIFINFFYCLFMYNDKEQSVLAYMRSIIFNFLFYALCVYLSYTIHGLHYAGALQVDLFKSALIVDLNGYFLRSSFGILSAIFMGLLYINTNNARIFILELPFLIATLFAVFLISVFVQNYLLLFIVMEIITIIVSVACALYFVAIGPKLVKAIIKFFVLNLFITTLYLLGTALLIYLIMYSQFFTLSYFSTFNLHYIYWQVVWGYWNFFEPYWDALKIVIFLILVPIFFKLTLAPFSIWVVNVYSHLPQIFLLILLTFYKIVYMVIFIKLLFTSIDLWGYHGITHIWQTSLFYFLIPSFFVGCLAFRNQDLGQILAYTTVSNLGYILSGIYVGTALSVHYALIYLAVYSVQLISLFIIFIILHKKHKFFNLNQLYLVKQYDKYFYYALVLIFFSLAGVPPLAGFFTKYFLFLQLWKAQAYILALAGLVSGFIMSIIYLQITLQLVIVKRTHARSFYYESTKNGNTSYSADLWLSRFITIFTVIVIGSQTVNVLFFYVLPLLAHAVTSTYSLIYLLV